MPEEKQTLPPQTQEQRPGLESEMTPRPEAEDESYRGAGKLEGRAAIITGGDSGIGRAVAIAFAAEGASSAIVYHSEHDDAKETRRMVEEKGGQCILIAGDIGKSVFSKEVVRTTLQKFGRIDILVNNAAEQHPQEELTSITDEQLEATFRTNIFAMFYLTREVLPHLHEGAAIINTTSITAYRGSEHLLDYASTKAAIVGFTRSLSGNLAKKGIRVNAVAPGPIWTPLIPSTFDEEKVKSFGADTPMGRPGQPEEVAPAFVFLASDDSSYMTGQVLHVNGGTVING